MESLDRTFLVQTVMFFRPSLKTNTRAKALLEKRQPSSTILLLAKSTNAVGPLLRHLPLRPNHNGVSIHGVSTYSNFMTMCNFSDSYPTSDCHLSVLSIWYISLFEYVMYRKRDHSWVIFKIHQKCAIILCETVKRFHRGIFVTFRTHKLITYDINATCDHTIRLLLSWMAENAIKYLREML